LATTAGWGHAAANESLVKSRAPRGSYRKKSAWYATADAPPLDMIVPAAGIVGPPQAGYINS
jgi:hypothetical protein